VLAAGFPGAPARLVGLTPGNLHGTVGSVVSKSVVVRVSDSAGNGVPGVAVAVAGGGAKTDSVLVSDSAGRATVRWALNEKAGPQALTLAVDGVAPVRYTAVAEPGAAANLLFLEATHSQTRGPGTPARVRVTDVYGNPVPDALVAFSASAGSVRPARVMSGKDGVAGTTWVLRHRSGLQSLTAVLQKSGAKDVLELSRPRGSGATAPTRTATR
jgi:hypothetical protein